MRKPRLVFMQKSRKNREIALLFFEEGDGRLRGDGSAWSASEAHKFAFIWCVMTRNVSPMVVPTCISREVDGEKGGNE